jgi:hypothetical protein
MVLTKILVVAAAADINLLGMRTVLDIEIVVGANNLQC